MFIFGTRTPSGVSITCYLLHLAFFRAYASSASLRDACKAQYQARGYGLPERDSHPLDLRGIAQPHPVDNLLLSLAGSAYR